MNEFTKLRDISINRLAIMVGCISLFSLISCQEIQALLPATTDGLVTTFQGHTNTISSLAFSPDGEVLASGSADATIRLWETETTTSKALLLLEGHPNQVNSIAFSPDGLFLISGNGTPLGSTGDVRWEEGGTPYMIQNGTALPLPNMVILWEVSSGKELKRWNSFETGFWSVIFSPDGKIVAGASGTPTGSIDNAIRLWNVRTGELEATFNEKNSIWDIAFSSNGELLASANGGGITLWDVTTGQAIASLGSSPIRSVAYSPNNALLASGHFYNVVRLWDTRTNEELTVLDGHNGIVYAVAFSPDGTLLASAGEDGIVYLWNVMQREIIATIRIPRTAVVNIAFSPDGEMLATGGTDKLIRIWDVTDVLR